MDLHLLLKSSPCSMLSFLFLHIYLWLLSSYRNFCGIHGVMGQRIHLNQLCVWCVTNAGQIVSWKTTRRLVLFQCWTTSIDNLRTWFFFSAYKNILGSIPYMENRLFCLYSIKQMPVSWQGKKKSINHFQFILIRMFTSKRQRFDLYLFFLWPPRFFSIWMILKNSKRAYL